MNAPAPGLDRLARALREQYAAAPAGEALTALHRFGLAHAAELARLSAADLEMVAGAADHAAELRAMVALAPFVQLRAAADRPLSELFARYARPLPPGFSFDREEANAR